MATPAYLGEFEQLLLLAVLRLGVEAYGGDIARELEARAGRTVSRGALYTSLDRLEDKGLVRWKVADGSRTPATGCRAVSTSSRPPEWSRCVRRGTCCKRMWHGFGSPAQGADVMTAGRPPRLAEWLLRRMLPPGVRGDIDPRRPRRRLARRRRDHRGLAHCTGAMRSSLAARYALRRERPNPLDSAHRSERMFLDNFRADLRYAIRSYAKAPSFTLII